MKKIFFILTLFLLSFNIFCQVTLDLPYENGQVQIKANITVPSSIKTADSVRLEACYQSYSEVENPKVFKTVKTMIGLPKTIVKDYSFNKDESLQTYRCIVFQKGKPAITSNEVQIDYNGYKYSETPLPKITNLKGTSFEKDGFKYITLTWDAVPNAFGYKIGERDWNGAEQFISFQSEYGGEMSETNINSFTFKIEGTGEKEFGVCAVNKPYEDISKKPFADVSSVKVKIE